MRPFIAHPTLCVTEQLGSQMWHFAAMVGIARRSGHRILFFEEHASVGRGLQLHRHFNALPMSLVSIESLQPEERVHQVYPVRQDVIVDSGVFRLDSRANYGFQGLFLSYRYWYPIRREVAAMYGFSEAVRREAAKVLEPARRRGRPVVSVHVRRSDYLNGVFVNANADYYRAALGVFADLPVTCIVFSDDMAWCREAFAGHEDVLFAEGHPPIVDMAAMSACDHHVIANSSFSFWGAFLNPSRDKRIVCPARTVKNDAALPHANYAWYPDDFIGIDIGNA